MMKPSTKDQAEGKLHEVKGKIKQVVGEATTDPNLEISGEAEKQAGKVQQFVGRVEKAVGQ
ncbi:MAG: CsbD family protein [Terriglobales bacterium]